MSRSWKTMRILRENPEYDRHPRYGLRGLVPQVWHRPDVNQDEGMPVRDRRERAFRPSRPRAAAS